MRMPNSQRAEQNVARICSTLSAPFSRTEKNYSPGVGRTTFPGLLPGQISFTAHRIESDSLDYRNGGGIMAGTNQSIELAGTVHQVEDRLVLRFDQESSQKLPSRGQVAVSLVDSNQSVVVEPDGRRGHWLPAEQLGLELGQRPILHVTIAEQWPEVTLPEDLAGALEDASDLQDTWEGLTPMARWEWARWVKSTKNAATRQRRVEVSISKLRDGKRRPCCFDLSSCTDPEVAKSGKLIE